MIKGLAISTVWVLDQDRAKEFYTEKLGLEVRTDMTMGEGGMRWLTVGAKDQPDVELTLMVPGVPAMDPESAEAVKKLVSKGILGACCPGHGRHPRGLRAAQGARGAVPPGAAGAPVRDRGDLPRRLRELVLVHPAERGARPRQGVGHQLGPLVRSRLSPAGAASGSFPCSSVRAPAATAPRPRPRTESPKERPAGARCGT